MGIVNEYINKLLNILKNDVKENKEKPWYKYYGDTPEHLNYFKGSIYDYLKQTANNYPDYVAYKYFNIHATFKGFMRKIDKLADALMQFDIVENECITVCMPNTPESFALIYAINKIGAIANIVHPLSSSDDIKRALKEANSSVLFYADVSTPKVKEIEVEHKVLVPVSYSFNGLLKKLYNIKNSGNLKIEDNSISYSKFLSYSSGGNVYVKKTAEDPALILYSGGTTGKPKGIIISNGNLNAMALQTTTLCDEIKAGNSVLSALPIFHVFGIALCAHTCLTAGMTCIIVPKINTKRLNSELKKYKPNVFPAVPSLLKRSIEDMPPGKNAFKHIKVVVVGGDYLPEKLKGEMIDHLRKYGSNAEIKVGYGLSEATGFSCCTVLLDEKEAIDGTLGIPNPDMTIKIFEPNSDIEKEYGQVGEICISGPTIMMGYINEDQETRKTLLEHNDGKIYLHTGDLGYMNENGLIFYTSRLKRMIITNGYNVYPIELEDIICKCEYVESCTVVGIPHKIKNQTPKAVIVIKNEFKDMKDVKSKIKSYCMENIARYAVPTEYEFRDSIPKTAIGKVAYRDLEKPQKK